MSFMIIGGALQRSGFVGEGNNFTIKGGVALEMRLRTKARATKDLDLALSGPLQPIDALSEALTESYQGFTFSVSRKVHMMPNDTHRIDVSLDYKGRRWGTIQVDVAKPESEGAEVELVDAIDLSDFGLEGPTQLPCLPLPYQIAQKLHSVTRPSTPDRKNDRFRDLVDLLIMKDWIDDHSVLAQPCKEVFTTRATHTWPPLLVPEEGWEQPYTRLAKELDIETQDLHQAILELRHFVTQIDQAAPKCPTITQPDELTATTWHYAVRSNDSVVRIPFEIGDNLLRDRKKTAGRLKPEWFKDPGGLALIGVVVLLLNRKPLFIERVAVHSMAITAEADGRNVEYGRAVWQSLADDIVRRSQVPRRAMTALSMFLANRHGYLPAIVAEGSGDSTRWMQKIWVGLGPTTEPQFVWDLFASTPVVFAPQHSDG
ncbi:MAG: nucleotidyl transferase AbiEii/AbiGii toxin family protein [Gemmatimonadaceae bacterium]|nr:nucleotidyl transferase AbiEii/AbiGii toxin family protein [Gemmatimonadaceae bacterium]